VHFFSFLKWHAYSVTFHSEKTNMKRLPVYIAALLLLGACKKNSDDPETPARTGPSISQQGVAASLSAGTTLRFNVVNSNGGGVITVPVAGTDLTWNFASAPIATTDSMVLTASSNAAFPSANVARVERRVIALGAVIQTLNITSYYEISSSGWFQLGQRLPATSFTIPGTGTMDIPAQDDAFTPKLPVTPPFPFYLNDSVSFNSVITQNAIINVPPLLNNTPSGIKNTYAGKIKAIATGKVSLPGFSTALDAIVTRREQNITTNYLLNGVPAPAMLLSQIGVVDGQVTSLTYYDFYHQGNLGYLGYITVQGGSIINAYLRKP
jgi:hypothetical protein